ncbi:MAG TPA: NUDIX domain-containing protein [Stellaceae bacterium]|jgi:8-oxo-dGTP diphosphatase|nr:NUDIX domain-containing protein [Stellaceae bacterium]
MAEPINRDYPNRPFAAALAICRRGDKLLLAQRAKGPSTAVGRWGFPGGMHEVGETILAAAARELQEETGIEAEPKRVIDAFDVIGKDADGRYRAHFVLVCVVLDWKAGEGAPIEDASAVGWYTAEEALQKLELLPDTLRLMKAALG